MKHLLRPLSSNNPRVKLLGRLARRRRDRDEQRALLVEGPMLLGAALDAGVGVRDVYLTEERAADESVLSLLDRLDPGTSCWVVPAEAIERAGDAVTSQGLLAVVDQRESPLPEASEASFVLVLIDVADPGNAGTVIRAGVAAGVDAVVVVAGADPSAPKVLRASAGACFSVPMVRRSEPSEALAEVSRAGYELMGTVVAGGRDHTSVDLTGPVAIVVGNEARGLSEDATDRLDQRLTISMAGPTESLNVAMAATILVFEVLRQRRQP